MIRATTGGVMKSYRRNLMNSFISKNNAMNTVLTQRTFNSYAEDPAAAAKAFKLRKSRMTAESQYSVCTDTYKKFQSGFSSLDGIDKLLDTENGTAMNTLKDTTLRMLNDPTGDAREQLTTVLDQLSQAIVQDLNQKYGENFIFAGADGHNVPFEVKDNKLYYRGVPVDAAVPQLYNDVNDNPVKLNANGEVDAAGDRFLLASGLKTISQTAYENNQNDPAAEKIEVLMDANDPTMPAAFTDENGGTYYIQKSGAQSMTQQEITDATADAEKLKYLAGEKQFVDIGLGFQENNGKLIETSAFNAALNGLNFIGYGVDADGDPQNVYSIVQKLKDIGARVKDGENWSNTDYDEFKGLVGKLEAASSKFKTEFTNMSAGTEKLKNNVQLLDDNAYNLKEQYSDIEDVDMVEAISSFLWAEYAYNAALKVGNSVLSESLMDYLK